ncbi:KAP family NTPase [Brucella pseudogrignonensis]|uniref:KAP family P-loop NTPase fold protein n=1 Tax=Brucella pseudogrignonensis TaxID=419475 RepID=UPI001E43572F|nr:P-loop NTPase fold protein [Brucella pseudogrignonensis]MCD4512497.1 KAP family NTPase [Brucella pseudogrignonensis]
MSTETTNDVWRDDLLDRKRHAEYLKLFLIDRSKKRAENNGGAYVLNIDANWGVGKSFFIERFSRQLSFDGHIVVNVNAWKDDHANEPFIAVLAAIDRVIKPLLKKEPRLAGLWRKTKSTAGPLLLKTASGVGRAALKKYADSELNQLLEEPLGDVGKSAIEGGKQVVETEIEKLVSGATEKLLTDFNKQSDSIELFRNNLGLAIQKLASEKKLPLFVFIDELDRCRPSYAISLLERVKHLFDATNIVFVFATNTDQLQHAISGAYGPSFNGYRYLKRFFERTYSLPQPDPTNFAKALAKEIDFSKTRSPDNNNIDFLIRSCKNYDFDLREIQQLFDLLESSLSAWQNTTKIDLVALIPLIAQFIKENKADWQGAYKLIPENFNIDIGHVNRAGISTLLNVSKTFNELRAASKDLQRAVQIHQNEDRNDPNMSYAANSFVDEWENTNARGASLQFRLPTIVTSAGNFLQRK